MPFAMSRRATQALATVKESQDQDRLVGDTEH